MSTLFAVRVLEVSPQVARLGVTSVHPDSGPPAPRAVFALMLIYDPILNSGYREFTKYEHLEDSPLAQAIDRQQIFDSAWLQANARAFVAEVTVRGPFVEIRPTHPGWIEHLKKGMKWETAAYDGGPGLPAAPRVPAPRGAPTRVDDPNAGFRVGPLKYAKYDLEEAVVPLYGPNRYVAEPVLKSPAAMAKAADALLGQPVLIVPKRGPTWVGTLVQHYAEGVALYFEGDGMCGGFGMSFVDIKSLGRAWLLREDASAGETAAEAKAEVAAKKTAKKKTAKKTATKKTAAKASEKKKAAKAKPAAAKKKAATKKAAKKTGRR